MDGRDLTASSKPNLNPNLSITLTDTAKTTAAEDEKKPKPVTLAEQWCFYIVMQPKRKLKTEDHQAFAQLMEGKNSDETTLAKCINYTYEFNLLNAHLALLLSLKKLHAASSSSAQETKEDDEKAQPAEKKVVHIVKIMRYIKHKIMTMCPEGSPASEAKVAELVEELSNAGELAIADDLIDKLQSSFGRGELSKEGMQEYGGLSEEAKSHYKTTYLRRRAEITKSHLNILKRANEKDFDKECTRLINEVEKLCGDTYEEQKQMLVTQKETMVEPDVSAIVQLADIPAMRLARSASISSETASISSEENHSSEDEASDGVMQKPSKKIMAEDIVNELKIRVDPDAVQNGKRLIYYIIKNNHFELLPILIKWEVNVNLPCTDTNDDLAYPLAFAVSKGHHRLVLELMQAGAKIRPSLFKIKENSKDNTIFHLVANGVSSDPEKYQKIIRRLLKKMPIEEKSPGKQLRHMGIWEGKEDDAVSPVYPGSPSFGSLLSATYKAGKSKESFSVAQIKKYWLKPNKDNQSAFYILCKRWLENKVKYQQAKQHHVRAMALLDAEIRLINTKIRKAGIQHKLILQAKREELLQAKLKLIEGAAPTAVFETLKNSANIVRPRRWWTRIPETLARIRKIDINQPINFEAKHTDPLAPDAQLNMLNRLIHTISQENLGEIGTIIDDIESGKNEGSYFSHPGSNQPNPILLAADLSAKAVLLTKNLVSQVREAERTLGTVRAYLHEKIYGHCDNASQVLEGVDPKLLTKMKHVDKIHNQILSGKLNHPGKLKNKLENLQKALNIQRHPWLTFWKNETTSAGLVREVLEENFKGIQTYSARAQTHPQQAMQRRKSRIGYT